MHYGTLAGRSSLPLPPTVCFSATSAAFALLPLTASASTALALLPLTASASIAVALLLLIPGISTAAALRHLLARRLVLVLGLIRILVPGHLLCASLALDHLLIRELALSVRLGCAFLPFLDRLSNDETGQDSDYEQNTDNNDNMLSQPSTHNALQLTAVRSFVEIFVTEPIMPESA